MVSKMTVGKNHAGALSPRLVLALVLLFGGTIVMLGTIQRSMLYYPTSVLEMTPEDMNLAYEDIFLETSDGVKLHGWFVPGNTALATLLFLHGNAGNISHRVENIKRLNALGLNVFILDYRGYGRSEGSPHEKGLYLDAEAAFSYLLSRNDVAPNRIAVFGRSLGGAVAVDLCSRVNCQSLILESTFTSMADMSRAIFPFLPVGRFLPERYDSEKKIKSIRIPLLQFHGNRDEIIPFKLGQALFEHAPGPKEFVPIPGAGHNNTYGVGGTWYLDKIREFLAED